MNWKTTLRNRRNSRTILDKLTRVQTFIDLHNHPKSTSPTTSQPQVSQSIESISSPQSDTTTVLSNSESQLSASLPHSASLPQLDSVATLTGASYTPESTNQ